MLLSFLSGNYERNFKTLIYKSNTNKNMEQLKPFICRTAALAFFPFLCLSCMARNKSKYSRVTKNQ